MLQLLSPQSVDESVLAGSRKWMTEFTFSQNLVGAPVSGTKNWQS
jgi:hypothetical protein